MNNRRDVAVDDLTDDLVREIATETVTRSQAYGEILEHLRREAEKRGIVFADVGHRRWVFVDATPERYGIKIGSALGIDGMLEFLFTEVSRRDAAKTVNVEGADGVVATVNIKDPRYI